MKNAMQLKAIIKNLAKEKHVSAQLVMQNFMLERLLERISISKYKQNFILKGGFLIAAMVGLDTRATMDMDATIKGLPVNEQTVREMFEEICKIELEDDVTFSFRSIGEIREGDVYTGYRVSLSANYPPMAVPLKLDITTGDKITPKEIEYQFKRGCKKSCVYGEIIFPDMNQICRNLLSNFITFALSNFFSDNSIANSLNPIHAF